MTILNKTANKILDVTQDLIQTSGFNAFSYMDIQKRVGIKTASIHYYFPSKQDLAFATIARYVENFYHVLGELKLKKKRGIKLLEAIANIYIDALKQGKFCVCGMLASDASSLPEKTNGKLQEFFMLNQRWIADAIETAKKQGDIKDSVDTKNAAALFLAVLEGGMLIARTQKNTAYLEAAIKQAMHQIKK